MGRLYFGGSGKHTLNPTPQLINKKPKPFSSADHASVRAVLVQGSLGSEQFCGPYNFQCRQVCAISELFVLFEISLVFLE